MRFLTSFDRIIENPLFNWESKLLANVLIWFGYDPHGASCQFSTLLHRHVPLLNEFFHLGRLLANPLLFVKSPRIIRLLARIGYDPNGNYYEMNSVPYCHLDRNRPECFDLLLESGANINARNNCGTTLFESALSWHYDPEDIDFLISRGADTIVANSLGATPMETTINPLLLNLEFDPNYYKQIEEISHHEDCIFRLMFADWLIAVGANR